MVLLHPDDTRQPSCLHEERARGDDSHSVDVAEPVQLGDPQLVERIQNEAKIRVESRKPGEARS